MNALPLEIENLNKVFVHGSWVNYLPGWLQRHRARGQPIFSIQDLTMQVQRGEIYGIIGANGSGKSTLVRIISTLLLPDSGMVQVFGYDVTREPGPVRRLINRVSADPSFFRMMSALENLAFFAKLYGLEGSTVRREGLRILNRLDLGDRAREPLRNLSRGQQQKVAIARAFLTSPTLMLLDEPTTGLDPRSKRDVQTFIQEVRTSHDATILLTTHDMEEAERLCDRIAFLDGGRIIAKGTPADLRRQVARDRPLEEVTLETVFLELTGRDLAEDVEVVDV